MKTAALIIVAAFARRVVCDYKPLVTSEALEELITLEDLLAGSQKLQDIADANGGQRAFGGAGHNATVDFLYDTLVGLDAYDVYKQPFVELFTAGTVEFAAGGEDYSAEYMTYGPGGDVSAPLVAVSNLGCDATDYPAEVSGSVALISRGTCPFAAKAQLAKAAGAVGAVIYNNVPGNLQGTLGAVDDYAPTVGVTDETGAALLAKIEAGETVATYSVTAINETRTTYNVIAETKGGKKDDVLMLGGHTDSVYAGPGINDDGSGTIGVLTVAKALAGFSTTHAVRFGFWSAEEYGLLGSEYYLKSINGTLGGNATEVGKIRAYLNFDMIASPNYVLGIYDGDGDAFNLTGPAGSDTIEKDFQDFYRSKGLPYVDSIFSGRSDYAAYLENGIAAGGLFTGAEVLKTAEEAALFGGEADVPLDVCYHQACDTIDNLAHDAYLVNTQSIANSVAKYALSWEGIPKPNITLRRRAAENNYRKYFARQASHVHLNAAPCGHSAVEI